MFDTFKNRFFLSAAPRVVHNLPGRVRIHLPALERLSTHWHRYSGPVAELVMIKKGIQSTDIQPATGNVLITYDAATMAEKDVFNWLESIVHIFLDNIRNYASLSEDNFESLLNRVENQLMGLEN